jgi:hypothetical protein
MVAKTKKGKGSKVDVRSAADLPAFNQLFKNHPMVIVLVHADFCGHCQTYKDDVWNGLHKLSNRKAGLGSIHFDQLERTPLANAKINGYPSVLLVGKDGVPAEFSNDGETTNAMNSEDARNKTLMENITKMTPTATSLPNIVKPPNVGNEDENVPELSPESKSLRNSMSNSAMKRLMNKNALEQEVDGEFENVNGPPDVSKDMLNSQRPNNNQMEFSPNSNTPLPKEAVGGSLYHALASAAYKVAPAVAITAAGVALSRRISRRKRRHSKRSRVSRLSRRIKALGFRD